MSCEVVGGEDSVGDQFSKHRTACAKALAHLGAERRPKRLEMIKEEEVRARGLVRTWLSFQMPPKAIGELHVKKCQQWALLLGERRCL